MCLIIKEGSKPIINLTDIVVYKHIISTKDPEEFLTSYQRVPVQLGVTYKSELKPTFQDRIEIGLHSYLELEAADDSAKEYKGVLVECIVPEGSTYYEGEFIGESSIASDTLIYIQVIKDYTNVNR